MRTRNVLLWLFVALFGVTVSPERATAQCWFCDTPCSWEDDGEGCVMKFPTTMGWSDCLDYPYDGRCWCYTPGPYGNCREEEDEDPNVAAVNAKAELMETLAAIKVGDPLPVDGSFFYVGRGPDLVVRRKCDMTEVARVAVAEVRPGRILAGG